MDFKQIREYIIECGKRYKEPDIEEWEWEDIENLTGNEIILFAIKENAPFSKEKVERFLDKSEGRYLHERVAELANELHRLFEKNLLPPNTSYLYNLRQNTFWKYE